MKITDSDRSLIALLAILVTIGLLTKVSGGINVAVITPLLTVLGMLAQNFRKPTASDHKENQP